MNLSINRIFSIGFTLIVIAILSGGLVTRLFVFGSFKDKQQQDLTLHAQTISKIIALDIEKQISTAVGFIDTSQIKTNFEHLSPAELTEQSVLIKNYMPEVVGFAIFNQEGEVLGDPVKQGITPSCLLDIKTGINSNHGFASPAVHRDANQIEHFDIVMPFKTKTSSYQLLFSLKLELLNKAINYFSNDSYYYLLQDDNGNNLSETGVQGLPFQVKATVPNTQWNLQVEAPKSKIEDTLKYPKRYFIFIFFFLLFAGFILKTIISFYLKKDIKSLHRTIEDIDKEHVVREIETSLTDFDQLKTDIYTQALDLQNSRKSLAALSVLDPLTGVSNRRALDNDVKNFQSLSDRGLSISLVLMDLNNFKSVNDELGHQLGDELLIKIAQVFKNCIRDSDQVYRLGGDEFLVILSNANEEQANLWKMNMLNKVHEMLNQFTELKTLPSPVGVSAGIAACDGKGTLEKALAKADKAMYQEKEQLKKD